MAQTKDRPVEISAQSASAFVEMTEAEAAEIDAAMAKMNEEARDEMVAEFGVRTAEEVGAGVSGDTAFSVRYRDAEVFPSFQFEENGRPLPVIANVLAVLREVRSPWQIAMWLTGANLWLEGDRPVDRLRTEPVRVVEAARHEIEEIVL